MPRFLPLRCDLNWVELTIDARLRDAQAGDPTVRREHVQAAFAKEFGFATWEAMVEHVGVFRKPIQEMMKSLPPLSISEEPIASDDPKLTELLRAIRQQDLGLVVAILSAQPSLASVYGLEGKAPLHVAVECDDGKTLVFLLAFEADPFARIRNSHHDALSWAVTCSAIQSAKQLVRLGAFPDFFVSAGAGLLEQVKACFDADDKLLPGSCTTGSSRYDTEKRSLPVPPESDEERISDALSIAARNGLADIVQFLLTKRPNLDFRSFAGATPLHWAHFSGDKSTIDLLRNAGANPDARDTMFGCDPKSFCQQARKAWGLSELVPDLDESGRLCNDAQGRELDPIPE